MTSLRDLTASARAVLPDPFLAFWASVFFSFSVLTILISLTASEIFLAAAVAAYIAHWLLDRPAASFPAVKVPLALFCLLTLLSVLGAGNRSVGLFPLAKLWLFSILLLGVNLVEKARHLRLLYQGLFLEAVLTGIVGAGQFMRQYRAAHVLRPEQVYDFMTGTRITGFMSHWMHFGGQQMLVFAALLAFLLSSRLGIQGSTPKQGGAPNAEFRVLWWVVLGIVAASIVLNFTRGVWLGCFVATLDLLARYRRRWLWALPFLIVGGLLAAPRLVRHRLEVILHPSSDPALAIRFEMYEVGGRIIRAHPLLGVGPNNIGLVYERYLPTGEKPVPGYHGHLHNDYLQFGAERGLPCLAAWLWLMGAFGWHCLRVHRELRGKGATIWVADAARAGWLAFVSEGFFEFNFGTSPVLMLFLFVASSPFIVERTENQAMLK